ncbi:cytochrome C [Bradyrhizobium guangdongense]|uniref:di-heme-cytochrome C peroxidase n=1 Tax=Bradyrhizobium guangdongense TaxID=1325090 RepID=UPI00112D2FB0|nr:di-heme-cytochrome C peroxidase [Bradyrhizobium guangdongense]TPQ37558.1 cytochrome C [Bradyrhizobium guangdongense]
MADPRTPLNPSIEVSKDNPCPFLRGLVGEGYVGGGTVPLGELSQTIGDATGKTGLMKVKARAEISGVAAIANGIRHIWKSLWRGAQLDALRNGPLDKHGAGSRILSVEGVVNEDEIARLATFGRDYTDPWGGTERGLNAAEIKIFMHENLKRAGSAARWYYPVLMQNEWPVLLDIMGKGDGDSRYLSVAEVRTLFTERKFPARIEQRIVVHPPVTRTKRVLRWVGAAAAVLIVLLIAALRFPDQLQPMLPNMLGQLVAPPLPARTVAREAYWLQQNWALEDRHWFHHVSQGTATFPVPYSWFMALEQPRLYFVARPGLLSDNAHLERFGFIPSPRTINADETTLRRYGYANVYETAPPPVPARQWEYPVKWDTPVDNVGGLPVGFARMTGVRDPATGRQEEDKIGLTCAACHTGQIHYKGVDVRFDGGPAMTDLKKLESTTGLSIMYTLYVPGRFTRFANRVLGASASDADRKALRQKLSTIGWFLLRWQINYGKIIEDKTTWDGKQQKDTEEGFGRLDALNRIGNQVFAQDLTLSGVEGFEKNLHAQDAPVSFPPIWTVPWLKYAQYDASIEQPLIRNAGEALGVTALLNLSDAYPKDTMFRSSIEIKNLHWIEEMLRGSPPKPAGKLSGLLSPKWPSQIFGDGAWAIDTKRVERGRQLYADICVECHLGPVNDPVFDSDDRYKAKSVWASDRWKKIGDEYVLDPVQKSVQGMGTDSAQAYVLAKRTVQVPGFLNMDPTKVLEHWDCKKTLPATATEMPYATGLMAIVEKVSKKAMDDARMPEDEQTKWWGGRKNCLDEGPADQAKEPAPWYRARPLNGVWATAPYLHNGSVPSLYWMLSPARDRPKSFCMGNREYDPKQVGFAVTDNEWWCKTGQTRFKTTTFFGTEINGNSNAGHSFEGTPGPNNPGVIGRLLKEDERYDLIEYLKTL